MSKIITFYSYKGGVGRTMCLANVSIMLAQWGYNVLVVDWDLEAPGLENFYKGYIDIDVKEKNGLINLLTDLREDINVSLEDAWKSCLNTISIDNDIKNIQLITSGKRDETYYEKVRSFDVNNFYQKKGGGELIEDLRNSWKSAFDYILIDSRTGITDIGGICTIQLPDILVLLFTATNQGFKGIRDVAQKAIKARQELPIERISLLTLPLPTRIDNSEKKQTDEWIKKFKEGLQDIYSSWMPESVDQQNFLTLTKVPYIAYHSYGEKLPVIEANSTVDTTGIAYAYQSISALLATELNYPHLLLEDRGKLIKLANQNYLKQNAHGILDLIAEEMEVIKLTERIALQITNLINYSNELIKGKNEKKWQHVILQALSIENGVPFSIATDVSILKKEIAQKIFNKLEPIGFYFIDALKDDIIDIIRNQLMNCKLEIQAKLSNDLKIFPNLNPRENSILIDQVNWIVADFIKEVIINFNYLIEKWRGQEINGSEKVLLEDNLAYVGKNKKQVKNVESSRSIEPRRGGGALNQAFIIRPFGNKQGIDFDKVDKTLILPALRQVGISGITTASIVNEGNIREDMFAQLLLADLVIADMSIHNANVFYELGIRHALRDKKTFLIRCTVPNTDVPFDLKTDRYLEYPADNPEFALDTLVAGLKGTMLSDKADSPVFYMLPKLEAQDPERFLPVPQDFGEEVKLAVAAKQIGKLALLASEANGFTWEIPAIRKLGEALFQLKDFEASAICWEKVTDRYINDLDANDRLATIYQRQAEDELILNPEGGWELLGKSDAAIERLLTNGEKLNNNKKAEIYSLKGRNAKTRWIGIWRNAEGEERKIKALRSTGLNDAYELYEQAFNEDLNHFYSGINALGLLTIIISLAERIPEVWTLEFDTDEKANEALQSHKARHRTLTLLVQASIEAKRERTNNAPDIWLNVTEADLACLISNRPLRVGGLYQKVIQEANDLNFDAAKRQLIIYDQLGVQSDNVSAGLNAFAQAKTFQDEKRRHYLLFTGHMIDKKDRTNPRFPASMEQKVRTAIKDAVQSQKEKYGDRLKAIAGGACGGDILFHEVCAELNIEAELYLVLPREQFIVESVEFAGNKWVDRFDVLFQQLPRRILSNTKELPRWLQPKPEYSIWERNNLWMLNSALVFGGTNMTMIALWDRKGGDGRGGTEHMVNEAEARGAKTIILDINSMR